MSTAKLSSQKCATCGKRTPFKMRGGRAVPCVFCGKRCSAAASDARRRGKPVPLYCPTFVNSGNRTVHVGYSAAAVADGAEHGRCTWCGRPAMSATKPACGGAAYECSACNRQAARRGREADGRPIYVLPPAKRKARTR